ncbi:isopentenyl-diphosphate Delta-isomerase [Pseudahrensia aquimaris]|uniref:isopentenyl-diphosphate Delta-isomerase n=1 Tax=Pseudahrensia aquimaris TaxID=744461 RepID=A0ABW3FI81_9HYPH
MLDEVLFLTPDAEDGPADANGHDDQSAWPIPASDPPIMIPGIAADDTLYPVEKIEAHIKGLHHVALSVFVFDGPRLLIQRRAFEKYHCGGQWANTCCTHPHMDEDIQTAAKRRLREELGFELPIDERLIVEYSADVGGGLWERERVHMFRAEADRSKLEIKLNPDEVYETKWLTGDELRTEMALNPADFTPWFRIYVNRYPALDF